MRTGWFGLELAGATEQGKGLEQSYTGLGHSRSTILCYEATSQVTRN